MKIIYKDGHVDECPQDQELHVIRHTAAHIMAQAIKRLYPQADFAFGPATENGFYYDVDLGDTKLTDDDLANIEKEMRKIVKENLPIKPFILPRAEAVKLMEERKENYKIEHMADLADETEFSFFQQGEYVDMCIGPHLTYTKALKAFKITQQSGAYWKNDKENKMLTRINGVAFRNQEDAISPPAARASSRACPRSSCSPTGLPTTASARSTPPPASPPSAPVCRWWLITSIWARRTWRSRAVSPKRSAS